MKTTTLLILVFCLLAGCSKPSKDDFITRSMDVARKQALLMAEYLDRYPDMLPRTYSQELDSIFITGSRNWISGYFPGVLWYLYEYHNDVKLKKHAVSFLSRVEKEKYSTYDHDIGLQIGCSFGNAYRITGDEAHKDVILTTAQTLSKRFNKNIGLIRSWDFGPDKWQYPVIIDNMMPIEILMQAFHLTGDSLYYHIAVIHSDNTLKNHFRPDHFFILKRS
jgi:unsaturated chondroitin disaccharide hydrolase